MRVGVMTTDGGPHPADKWAEETAGEIMSLVKVDPDTTDDSDESRARKRKARSDKMRMEADILEAVETFHAANQDNERSHLSVTGDERLSHDLDPHPDHLDGAVEAVVAIARKYGSPYAEAFDSANGRELVTRVIRAHMKTAMDIERSWHADRQVAAGNLSDHVRAFRSLR